MKIEYRITSITVLSAKGVVVTFLKTRLPNFTERFFRKTVEPEIIETFYPIEMTIHYYRSLSKFPSGEPLAPKEYEIMQNLIAIHKAHIKE